MMITEAARTSSLIGVSVRVDWHYCRRKRGGHPEKADECMWSCGWESSSTVMSFFLLELSNQSQVHLVLLATLVFLSGSDTISPLYPLQ